THTYSVDAYNEDGAGNPAVATAYVGPNVPLPPVSVKAELTEEIGEVCISWVPSEVDVDGNVINPALVKYTILTTDRRGQQIEVATGISDTEYTYSAVNPNEEQRLMNFAVISYSDAGSTSLTVSNLVAVGKPYEMPFIESFPNNAPSNSACGMTQYDAEEYSYWGYYNDKSLSESSIYVVSCDDDNGFVGYTAKAMGGKSGFRTGRIAINNGNNPTFRFYHFVTNVDDTNEINVVAINSEGEEKVIKKFYGYENIDKVGDWEEIIVPLKEYAGQEICLEINVTCSGYAREFFDGLMVYNLLDHNLQAQAIDAATLQNVGKARAFNVVVRNFGTKPASGYSVELYRDGVKVGEANGPALDEGESAKIRFNQTFSVLDNEEVTFYGVVNYAEDENNLDNKTPDFVCTVVFPDYPSPENLVAVKEDNGVKLTWNTVATQHTTPIASTETFEDYNSWEHETLGEWTLVDGDGHKPGITEGLDLPFGRIPTSFFVFDNSDEAVIPAGYQDGFAAYSGTKFMSNIFPYGDTGSTVDDWLITPELIGTAQTVSFYARSYRPNMLETFEILTSDKGTDIKDFELVSTYRNVPSLWTRFSVEVPAGTKYVAIHCISSNKFMFFVDDVNMILKNGPVNLATLRGYNIYRDGQKLNASPVSSPLYLEEGALAGNQAYRVSAVYDKGESRASDIATLDPSGIGNVMAAGFLAYAQDGVIYVAGAEGAQVNIYAADGTTIHSGIATSTLSVAVNPGIYMVRSGKSTVKVIVR
ncbi:MAG: choice-of-anchor J domain-containing protein, partial [Muribaculaceae bacterium]|nr:choice-of-anchor J domain-containing protein [Muribaculaceae bacterium]